jgi:hypothetical protein
MYSAKRSLHNAFRNSIYDQGVAESRLQRGPAGRDRATPNRWEPANSASSNSSSDSPLIQIGIGSD